MTLNLIKNRGGFTLIELVVIMVLIGILAAVFMPRVLNPSSFRASGYFDDLVSATRFAQKLAVATGCEARISIMTDYFTLQQPANAGECGGPPVNWQSINIPGSEPPYTAPPGVVTSPTTTITFSASGIRTDQNTNQDFSVNGIFTMRVHAATGYVERL